MSMSNEVLFDAVVAVGAVHKAALLHAQAGSEVNADEMDAVAVDSYVRAKDAIYDELSDPSAAMTDDSRVATLLLLALHQCFSHDAAAAFSHLKTVKMQFLAAQEIIQNISADKALRTPIRRLDLMAKSLLPQLVAPMEPAVPVATIASDEYHGSNTVAGEKEALTAIVSEDDFLYVAIWKQFSGWTMADVAQDQLHALIKKLNRWRSKADLTFARSGEGSIFEENEYRHVNHRESLQQLPIPPARRTFQSHDAAMAAALYHCYMTRVMRMLSSLYQDQEHITELSAYIHLYELLRITAGILGGLMDQGPQQSFYVPRESINVSLSALLFLASHCSYSAAWQDWIASALQLIGVEGLNNATAYAKTLDILGIIADRPESAWARSELAKNSHHSYSPVGHVADRLIPILSVDLSTRGFTAYYVFEHIPYRDRKYIVATASWVCGDDVTVMQNTDIQFYDSGSHINTQLSDGCVYCFIGNNDPVGIAWQRLLTS
ncbi:MAG: hypothetical protein Q9162_006540 [Coniocarpon cinnabarinum]